MLFILPRLNSEQALNTAFQKILGWISHELTNLLTFVAFITILSPKDNSHNKNPNFQCFNIFLFRTTPFFLIGVEARGAQSSLQSKMTMKKQDITEYKAFDS